MVQNLLSEHRLAPHIFAQPTAIAMSCGGAVLLGVWNELHGTARRDVGPRPARCVGRGVMRSACGLGRGVALLCGVLLLVNPLHASLSYTFMTDVRSARC